VTNRAVADSDPAIPPPRRTQNASYAPEQPHRGDDRQRQGTIRDNDDPPNILIDDVTVFEGHDAAKPTAAYFRVSLIKSSAIDFCHAARYSHASEIIPSICRASRVVETG
jgi:hypothetical protein